jgi:SDR family mycofactocin-dependent oxidoreductase
MTARLEGKVAFITGAARGQGRSHALRFAEEGADVIVTDLCAQMESVAYPQGSSEELEDIAAEVRALGRKAFPMKADVRDREQLASALAAGVEELGHVDTIVCNAGILPLANTDPSSFVDGIDVDLVGVFNTVAVSLPYLAGGATITITGSTAGLMEGTVSNPALGPGGAAYGFSKKTLVEYTEMLSLVLGPRSIRVNCVHPTNCNTDLLHNDQVYGVFRPDLVKPTIDDVMPAFVHFQSLPIPWVEPVDISNAIVFLASDEARYITGIQLRVDAGSLPKWPSGPKG